MLFLHVSGGEEHSDYQTGATISAAAVLPTIAFALSMSAQCEETNRISITIRKTAVTSWTSLKDFGDPQRPTEHILGTAVLYTQRWSHAKGYIWLAPASVGSTSMDSTSHG